MKTTIIPHSPQHSGLTAVERRAASVISRFPLSPTSAGTRMNTSVITLNTFQCWGREQSTHTTLNTVLQLEDERTRRPSSASHWVDERPQGPTSVLFTLGRSEMALDLKIDPRIKERRSCQDENDVGQRPGARELKMRRRKEGKRFR
ncbi:hypothetical protein EYF80_059960 [Liparis tanakae]|uniref:Uncharacterized protein n=1 Tax=Liparis tanakae TaxID=230148 RepID=A0A4Z2EMU8_9TELE|nr:hypothetical protein EYF80_059960 [Liparis tanakae]